MEQKVKYSSTKDNMAGYQQMGQEKLDEQATKGDTKEGFFLRFEDNPGLKKVNPDKFGDPREKNILKENRWPDSYQFPKFKAATTEYTNAVWELGFKVLHIIAECLELPANYFDSKYKDPFATVRALHYSNEVSKPEERLWGCGAHSDYGMLTVLQSDQNDGLQIYNEENDQWSDVKPVPGTFIIFIGDMLKGITGGYLRSAIHRVLNMKGVERYSSALFLDPDPNSSVEQIPNLKQFVSRPYKFPFNTYIEYIQSRLAKTYMFLEE